MEEWKNGMLSFRSFALVSASVLAIILALSLPVPLAQAQDSGSVAAPTSSQSQAQASSSETQGGETQGELTVQARIRLRREQRRAAAIHEAYDHRYEAFLNAGYLRFTPGPNQQRSTFYGWDTGLTRYYSERMGVSFDARGYSGIAYVGIHPQTQGGFSRPKISQYDVMAGPTYRFYMQPKYSISGRALAGWSLGNFTGDTNGQGSLCNNGPGAAPSPCLLYPDGSSFAANVAIVGDYNFSPNLVVRLAPEYMLTGFGSTLQASRGFTIGLAYRFGKQ